MSAAVPAGVLALATVVVAGLPPASRAPTWVRPIVIAARARPLVAIAAAVLLALEGALATVLAGALLGLLVVVVLVVVAARWSATAPRRRAAQADALLPAFAEEVARALRAGGSLTTAILGALDACPPVLGGELAPLVRALGQGRGVARAADEWARAADRPGVRLTAAALAVAAEVGGGAARCIDGVAQTLRERAALHREAAGAAAQARASGWVLAAAPIAFALLAALVDPRSLRFLLGTSLGRLCLLAGASLDAIGAWWMRRMTARVAQLAGPA